MTIVICENACILYTYYIIYKKGLKVHVKVENLLAWYKLCVVKTTHFPHGAKPYPSLAQYYN
jgi:hypothetical protein